MRAGRLNRKIIIESKTTIRDDLGQPKETWTQFVSVWASVEPQGGKETFTADQLQAELVTRFRIRYLAGLDTQMRILFNSLYYDIHSVLNTNDRKRETLIHCVSRND